LLNTLATYQLMTGQQLCNVAYHVDVIGLICQKYQPLYSRL